MGLKIFKKIWFFTWSCKPIKILFSPDFRGNPVPDLIIHSFDSNQLGDCVRITVLTLLHHPRLTRRGKPKIEKTKKPLTRRGETQNREKNKKTLTRKGESTKHIASKCSRIGEQCVEAHVHRSLERCAVFKPRSAVGLLLARSRSVPEVTTWPKPRNLNEWSLTLPRCWGLKLIGL